MHTAMSLDTFNATAEQVKRARELLAQAKAYASDLILGMEEVIATRVASQGSVQEARRTYMRDMRGLLIDMIQKVREKHFKKFERPYGVDEPSEDVKQVLCTYFFTPAYLRQLRSCIVSVSMMNLVEPDAPSSLTPTIPIPFVADPWANYPGNNNPAACGLGFAGGFGSSRGRASDDTDATAGMQATLLRISSAPVSRP